MSRKLLLADDSITIQKVIGITFVNEDFELSVVGNGDAALEQVRAERPDLILADVFMPGKNGYELCAAVKSDPALGTIPVLLLTGTFEPFDEEKAAQAGADGWIAKPFESQTLINRVHGLLEQAAANAPAAAAPVPTEETVSTDGSSVFSESESCTAATSAVDSLIPSGEEVDDLKEVDFGDILDMDEDQPDFPTNEVVEEELIAGEETAADDIPVMTDAEETMVSEASEPIGEDAFAITDEPLPDLDMSETVSPESEGNFVFAEEALGEEAEISATVDADLPELADEPLMAAADEIDFNDDDGLMELSEDDLLLLDEADAFAEEAPIIETVGKSEDGVSLLESVDIDAAAETADTTLVADDFFGGIVTSPESDPELPASETMAAEPETVLPVTETSQPDLETTYFSAEAPISVNESFFSEPEPAAIEPGGLDDFENAGGSVSGVEPIFTEAEPAIPALDIGYVADSGVKDRVEALSDEDVSSIVEKVAGAVVERLAGSILEKVAWEVVPDLAESLIRKEIHQIKEGIRQPV